LNVSKKFLDNRKSENSSKLRAIGNVPRKMLLISKGKKKSSSDKEKLKSNVQESAKRSCLSSKKSRLKSLNKSLSLKWRNL
jgi:hypothetical protein